MYGNTPFGGNPTTTPAGQRASNDTVTLTGDEKTEFRQDLRHLETVIGRHLPGIYGTSSGLVDTQAGIQGLITIHPPAGQPIGAGITPPMDDGELVGVEEYKEIAKNVVATAVAATIDRTNGEPPKVAR
jgi:hypothetical protein